MKKSSIILVLLLAVTGILSAQRDTTYVVKSGTSLIKHQEKNFPDGRRVVTDEPLTQADFSADIAKLSGAIHAGAVQTLERNMAAQYIAALDSSVTTLIGANIMDSIMSTVYQALNGYTWNLVSKQSQPASFEILNGDMYLKSGTAYFKTIPYSSEWIRVKDVFGKGQDADLFLWRGSFVSIDYRVALVASGKNTQPSKRTVVSRRQNTRE